VSTGSSPNSRSSTPRPDGLVLREVAPDVITDDVVAATGARLTVPDDVHSMALPATL
jgi:3-oxoacid CoA-transferase subunit B